jgi:hypothetical protein
MMSTPDPFALIVELEARQDEALAQLAELERQVEAVLAQALLSPTRPATAPQGTA